MVNRLVSVGDDFTLPGVVKVEDPNLPDRLQDTALNATIATAKVLQKYGKPDASRAFLQSKLEAINAAGGRVGVPGDSITEGNANGGYPWYNEWKTLYPNITFVNYGHGGKTTGDFISTYMAGIVADPACDLYVVALGCNDVRYANDVGTTGATTPAAFAANLATITGQLTPRGAVVVVNPWMTTVKDYKQELSTAAKEKAYWEYDRAAQSAMAALGIPYIQTTALSYTWYKDLIKATSWAVDGVHPDMAHTKVYARLVLFGAVPREEVIDSPQKAAQPYVYRLEILSRAPGDTSDRVWIKTLSATPAPAEIYGSSNRTGFMDPTVMTSAYNDGAVGYLNLDGDYPFNITWSSSTELQSLSYLPDAARKGIGNYRLWQSRDLESIGQPDHPSWRLLENGIRARAAAGTFQRMLYSRGRSERYFYKLAFTSMYAGDTAIEVTALTFPQNTGLDGIMAYNVSGADKTTQNICQMFQQNARSTTFTTTPSGVMVSTHVPLRLYNLTFATGKRADGWTLYQSAESGALEDFNHTSWKPIRSGLFGGSQTVSNVDTYATIPRLPVYTTAGRPSPVSAGAGTQIFDSTLARAITSDGTNWKDGAGTTV